MTVYGYTRVSTDRQADEGERLGAQQRVIEGYAMMLGLTLDEIFVERGISGAKPLRDRPEGARLLATLTEGDVLITPKLDRMSGPPSTPSTSSARSRSAASAST